MYQYIVGRSAVIWDSLTSVNVYENLFLSGERKDRCEFEGYKIKQSTFANMGFKKSKFIKCDFQHCVFIDCYFKEAMFENIQFTGCKFIDCNFDTAVLSHCDFRYASFRGCYIKYEAMKPNLPTSEHNLRWRLCINLAIETRKIGNINQYKKYYYEEQRASIEHHKNRILQSTGYYKKYSLIDKLRSVGYIIMNKLSDIIWGYGENINRLIKNIIIVIIGFGVIYCIPINSFSRADELVTGSISFSEGIYLSLCSLFTLSSDIFPNTILLKYCTVAEGGLGITLMGFFVTALFRSINKR